MPIIQRTNLNQNTVLAVWKISESREALFAQMSNRIIDSGKNLHDNIHWLASRVLLQELFPNNSIALNKDEFNKPSLLIDNMPYHVSITHSYEYAAVMVSTTNIVALDLEKIDERVNRVARKFIREDEIVATNDVTTYYTIIWSAKETLYKYYGKKELDFKEHLCIKSFELTHKKITIQGNISKGELLLNLPIHVDFIDNYVLTYSF